MTEIITEIERLERIATKRNEIRKQNIQEAEQTEIAKLFKSQRFGN